MMVYVEGLRNDWNGQPVVWLPPAGQTSIQLKIDLAKVIKEERLHWFDVLISKIIKKVISQRRAITEQVTTQGWLAAVEGEEDEGKR